MLMYRAIRKRLTANNNNKPYSWLASFVFLNSMANAQPLQAREVDRQTTNQQEYTLVEDTTSDAEDTHDLPVVLKVSPPEESDPKTLSAGTVPQQITVDNFEVVGSSVFSDEELAAVLNEYEDRPISLSELYQARSAITKLYTDKGYVNSGAYIPPQELAGGTVTISVLEGQLEDIIVTGTNHLDPDYIRSRIRNSAGTPVNVESLLEALQMLRIDPLIENVSAELSTGIDPGTSLLEVEVEEADPFKITAKFDNNRSPAVGTNRRSAGFIHSNLLGFGDRISFEYTNTEGSDSIDTSYTLPFNSRNGTLRFAYGYSDNRIVEDPFTILDIISEAQYYELGIRQPIVATPESEFAMGLSFSFQESETGLDNESYSGPLRLSRGANAIGETRVSALRFFQEYVDRSDSEVFALRSQFSFGLDVFGATEDAEGITDRSFFAWRGQSQWVRRLDEDFLFLLRGDIQLSQAELVPLEQFRVGGFNSVRGYRQDFALGDNGLFTSAEMRIPLFRIRRIDGVMQLTPFVDLGTIWNSDDSRIGNEFLAAVGIGLNFSAGNGFNARIDWGIPLVDKVQGDSLQEDGVYFTINWNFL